MAERMVKYKWVQKVARISFSATLVLLGLAFVVCVAGAVLYAMAGDVYQVYVMPAILGALLCLAAIGWTAVLYGLATLMVSLESSATVMEARAERIESILSSQDESLRKLTDLGALSDQAKALIFRDREIEAMREAISTDILNQDYKTAEHLVEQMEKRFGYADEAARLKEEIAASRKASQDEKIETAVKRVLALADRYEWATALREAKRLQKRFGKHEKVKGIVKTVEDKHAARKRDLLKQYDEAVKVNDVDRSIELLKELDRYLTPQEGAALAESARGVFKARLHNLGVQFSIAATDGQWDAAIGAGEQIQKEFPNSKMAQEVREKMDMLRAKRAEARGENPLGPPPGS